MKPHPRQRSDGWELETYLVRHGESEGNRRKVWQGRLDFPLTGRGREQAGNTARWLQGRMIEPQAVYTSDVARASQTANVITAQMGLPPARPDERLAEIYSGRIQGMNAEQIRKLDPGYFDKAYPSEQDYGKYGGETFAEITARLTGFVGDLADRHDTGPVLVVTHGACIRILLSTFCCRTAPVHFAVSTGNCSVAKLTFSASHGELLGELNWIIPPELMREHLG